MSRYSYNPDYSRRRRSSDGWKTFGSIVFIILFLVLIVCSLRGCTDEDGATRVLQQNGYTNIVITGGRWLGRSQGDLYCTGFEATSPNGSRVSGAVTSGVFKGATIRFD